MDDVGSLERKLLNELKNHSSASPEDTQTLRDLIGLPHYFDGAMFMLNTDNRPVGSAVVLGSYINLGIDARLINKIDVILDSEFHHLELRYYRRVRMDKYGYDVREIRCRLIITLSDLLGWVDSRQVIPEILTHLVVNGLKETNRVMND